MTEPISDELRRWVDPPEGYWVTDIPPSLRDLLLRAADRIDQSDRTIAEYQKALDVAAVEIERLREAVTTHFDEYHAFGLCDCELRNEVTDD